MKSKRMAKKTKTHAKLVKELDAIYSRYLRHKYADFSGYVQSLAYNFVRVGGLFESVTHFLINFENANSAAFIVRRPDVVPANPIVHSESVHGTVDQTREIITNTAGDPTNIVDYANAVQDLAADDRSQKLTICR